MKLSINQIDETVAKECLAQEIEWVLVHSNASDHVILDIAAEMISGARSRISFAPMVWSTGCFMAYEVIKVLLGKPSGADFRGVVLNPWTWELEKPKGFVESTIRRRFVKRFLQKLSQ